MALPATDDFNRTNANPAGGNWTTLKDLSAIQVSSNTVKGTSGESDAIWNADSFGNDQYSQITLVTNDNDGWRWGVLVRGAGASATTAYVLRANTWSAEGCGLSSWVAGSLSLLQTVSQIIGAGTVIRLEAQGTTLRIYDDGVQIGTDQTNSSIASGSAGISMLNTTAAADNWEGGNLAVSAISISISESLAFAEALD